jgi:hypothetical protein
MLRIQDGNTIFTKDFENWLHTFNLLEIFLKIADQYIYLIMSLNHQLLNKKILYVSCPNKKKKNQLKNVKKKNYRYTSLMHFFSFYKNFVFPIN